ncbi:MAG: hypothetical protein QOH31_1203 [Verrucomicrobiota bacterium]
MMQTKSLSLPLSESTVRAAPTSSAWWQSIYLQHGLKTGLGGILALYLAEALRLQYPYWSLFTVMVLMIVHYPGSIVLKSIYRLAGTLIGGIIAVWLVTDYFSTPIMYLSVTFLVVTFATYQLGKYGSRFGPYSFFLTGFTLITVESSALSQPTTAWSVALSRVEEVFIGIIATLFIDLIIRSRNPRSEFQELVRSVCHELGVLICCEISNPSAPEERSARLRQSQRTLFKRLSSLRNLLASARRERLDFRANTALLNTTFHSIDQLVRAVLDLDERKLDPATTEQTLGVELQLHDIQIAIGRVLWDLRDRLKINLADFNEAFSQLDAKILRFLQATNAAPIPVDSLSVFLRRWDALKQIHQELLVLTGLEEQLNQIHFNTQPTLLPLKLPLIDRRLLVSGIKGGLVAAISLFLVVWLRLPGGGLVPTAAASAVFSTSFEIPLGRPGDLRSISYLIFLGFVGLVSTIAELILMPYLSNYWILNVSLFAILFGYGYFCSKHPGVPFWILFILLSVSNLVSVDPQQPVSFSSIADAYLGLMTGLTLGVVISRCLWPALPQNELLKKARDFFQECVSLISDSSETKKAAARLSIETLPGQMAQAADAVDVSPVLRRERDRWVELLALLMRVCSHLRRLTSLDSKSMTLIGRLTSYLSNLRDFFENRSRNIEPHFLAEEIASLKDELRKAAQATAELNRPDGRPLKRLIDVNRCLVMAELLQQCGEIIAGLKLDEYRGDYCL